MAIEEIDQQGTITWICRGLMDMCGKENSVSIQDEAVRYSRGSTDYVEFPPCSKCGARMMARIAFTDKELISAEKHPYIPVHLILATKMQQHGKQARSHEIDTSS